MKNIEKTNPNKSVRDLHGPFLFAFSCMHYTLYYRKEVLNMENKGLQKVKQWTKDNKEKLAFVAATTVAVGGIIHLISKGEDVTDKLDVVEEVVEDIPEVKIFLGGLNDEKDAGAWLVNMVEEFKDADGNIVEYSMDKVAEDILSGNYKEI